MELRAGARRLGQDRVRGGDQPLGAGDVDADVLAPGCEDLLAEQLVARVGAHRLRARGGPSRGSAGSRSSPVGADLGRLGLGVVEAAPQAVLEGRRGRPRAASAGGTLISMLNWPSSVWNAGSAIASSTSAFFSAGSPASSTRLSSISSPVIGSSVSKRSSLQHPREHVEAAVDLLAVAGAVGPRELLCVDVLSHGVTLGSGECPDQARRGGLTCRPLFRSLRAAPRSAAITRLLPGRGRNCPGQALGQTEPQAVVGVEVEAAVERAPGECPVAGLPGAEGRDRARCRAPAPRGLGAAGRPRRAGGRRRGRVSPRRARRPGRRGGRRHAGARAASASSGGSPVARRSAPPGRAPTPTSSGPAPPAPAWSAGHAGHGLRRGGQGVARGRLGWRWVTRPSKTAWAANGWRRRRRRAPARSRVPPGWSGRDTSVPPWARSTSITSMPAASNARRSAARHARRAGRRRRCS